MGKKTKPSPAQIQVLRLMAAGNYLSVPRHQFPSRPYVRSAAACLDVHGNTFAAMRDRDWIETSRSSPFDNHWELTTRGHQVAKEFAT